MQIGKPGQGKGSNDTANLGAPANMVVDAAANELYVADGYVNHRVIVFDATTGAYKRHWGAYGNAPDDGFFTRAGETLPGPFRGVVQNENRPSQYDPNGPPSPQFRIVHAVRISKDGLVYVCDRTNDRLQVFTKAGKFLREVVINKDTLGSGSVWDVGFSTDPAQTFLYINDGTNQLIYVLHRETLQVVSTFGGAGHQVGQFYGAHVLAVNSKGDLFIGETYEGKRMQKFTIHGSWCAVVSAVGEGSASHLAPDGLLSSSGTGLLQRTSSRRSASHLARSFRRDSGRRLLLRTSSTMRETETKNEKGKPNRDGDGAPTECAVSIR